MCLPMAKKHIFTFFNQARRFIMDRKNSCSSYLVLTDFTGNWVSVTIESQWTPLTPTQHRSIRVPRLLNGHTLKHKTSTWFRHISSWRQFHSEKTGNKRAGSRTTLVFHWGVNLCEWKPWTWAGSFRRTLFLWQQITPSYGGLQEKDFWLFFSELYFFFSSLFLYIINKRSDAVDFPELNPASLAE